MTRGYTTTGHVADALAKIAVSEAARAKLHADALARARADKAATAAATTQKAGNQ